MRSTGVQEAKRFNPLTSRLRRDLPYIYDYMIKKLQLCFQENREENPEILDFQSNFWTLNYIVSWSNGSYEDG